MWRHLIILSALLMSTAAGRAEPPLSPPAFTAVVARAAAAALPPGAVTVAGTLHLETRSTRGEIGITDLKDAYEFYLADPQHLDDVVRGYVGVLEETVQFGDVKPALDRIVPILRPLRWLDALRRQRAAPPPGIIVPEPLSEPFNAELVVIYAEERPASIRFLTTRDDVGDRAQLHDLAFANLRRLIPKVEMSAGEDGIFLTSAGDAYEASLLLSDKMWSSGQVKVDGEIVVAVPLEATLFVTGSRNRAEVARMRALAAELATGPFALTPLLFVYRGGKFVIFDGD